MGIWIPGGVNDGGSSSYVPCEWGSGTDEEIVTALEKHYAGEIDLTEFWSIGDERTVHLSTMSAYSPLTDTQPEQDVIFVLSNIGGKYLSDGVTECLFQVDQKDCLSSTSNTKMSTATYSTGGWRDCDRRNWCNNIYYNAIPSTIKSIFKQFINQSGSGISNQINTSTDYFALRAEIEILNTTTYSTVGEGAQITYYLTSDNRIKNTPYWLRSTAKSYNNRYCMISNSGTVGYQTQGNNQGIAPFGVI